MVAVAVVDHIFPLDLPVDLVDPVEEEQEPLQEMVYQEVQEQTVSVEAVEVQVDKQEFIAEDQVLEAGMEKLF
jgi:hypothetical protein|tara:strand:+ start:548 stop:766 length:219 start_codon:yes stop_codon:yes gene_type:complete